MPKKSTKISKKNLIAQNFDVISSEVNKFNIVGFFQKHTFLARFFMVLFVLIVVSYFGLLRFGPVSISDQRYISVIGSYRATEANKVAIITATITETGMIKESVIQSVNKRTNNLIELIKNTGIDPTDVKTTSNAVYKVELQAFNANPNIKTPTIEQWRNSVSIDIKVRDLTKLSDLYSAINGLDNIEIFGPSFTIDDKSVDEARMLVNAIDDAKEKATFIAKNNKKRVGKIISIEELDNTNIRPYKDALGLGGGGSTPDLIPGSSEVSKSVFVKFELY